MMPFTQWIDSAAGQSTLLDPIVIAITQYGVPLVVLVVVLQWWSQRDRLHVRHTRIAAGLSLGRSFDGPLALPDPNTRATLSRRSRAGVPFLPILDHDARHPGRIADRPWRCGYHLMAVLAGLSAGISGLIRTDAASSVGRLALLHDLLADLCVG